MPFGQKLHTEIDSRFLQDVFAGALRRLQCMNRCRTLPASLISDEVLIVAIPDQRKDYSQFTLREERSIPIRFASSTLVR